MQASPNTFSYKAFLYLCIIGITALFLSSCTYMRYLEEDDRMLVKKGMLTNNITIQMQDGSTVPPEVKTAIQGANHYIVQNPNPKVLGIAWSRSIYCLANPDHDNFLSRYLRKKGDKPTIYNESSSERSVQQLQALLNSKGCFGSAVVFDTTNLKRKRVKIHYTLTATPRRKINEISYHCETQEVNTLMEEWRTHSHIHINEYYDQDSLTVERDALSEWLQNKGYFLANKEIINFQIDTTYAPQHLSVTVNISNPQTYNSQTKQLTKNPLRKYYLANIYIHPNNNDEAPFDTLSIPTTINNRPTDYKFIYSQKHGMAIKPQTICHNLMLYDGQLYRPRSITTTYTMLRNLRNFRYINIEMIPSPNSSDSLPLLNAHVKLLNSTRRRLSASLELNNASSNNSDENAITNGNFGLEASLQLQNRNLFGGAELFNIQISQLLELPKLIFNNDGGSHEFHDVFQTFETAIDMSLDIPKFLLPFSSNLAWQRIRPHTVLNLGGSYQFRPYFERLLFNASFGYSWSQNRRASHQFLPLELIYTHFFNLEDDFLNRIANLSDARLKYMYSDHFIMDARYDYIYNTQQFNSRTNFTYIHASLESAGNLLQLASKTLNSDMNEEGVRDVFNVPFSQYMRGMIEAKHYFYFGKKQTLVLRAIAGIGIPYGNSKAMPYEKGFYGGGPNTMRAWQLRYLGPGLYQNDQEQMFERVGDMTLVANIEHRFPLIGKFEGALFSDFGNVWLLNPSDEFKDGNISMKNFTNGIAAGVGVGLRFNISFLTLRLDAAIPVYDPGYEAEYRWRPPHWTFRQIVMNYGIDYPF